MQTREGSTLDGLIGHTGFVGSNLVRQHDFAARFNSAQFVAKLREGYDYVQGSRYAPGGIAENTPLERTIGNRLIHPPILSLAGRHWFTDTTNGFRAYSRRYLTDPRVQPFREVFFAYELLFYLTARAGQLGYRVCELGVRRSDPVPNKITGAGAKWGIIKQLLAAASGQFNPKSP